MLMFCYVEKFVICETNLPFLIFVETLKTFILNMSKQYGLIIPKNKKGLGGVTITRPSIFDEDSDSDSPKLTKPTGLAKARKQDKINQNKALNEDPTVYQYDEVYEKIEQEKMETKLAKKDLDKKPKYISRLLVAAERRKRENERRIEKQVQKEREAEGEQFKDKESFVTSSYKKKLEELKALEEQEKREEYLEAIGDVTKQGNLDGFYRHIYDQKVNFEDKIKNEDDTLIKKEIKEEKEEHDGSSEDENKRKRRASGDTDKPDNETESKTIKKNPGAKKRKYRSRKQSEKGKSDSESEVVEVKKEHLQSNLDADSDFSIDSSSDSENEGKGEQNKDNTKAKSSQVEPEGEKLKLPEKGNVLSDNVALGKKQDDKPEDNDNIKEKKEEKETNGNSQEEEKPKKPKIDIWKKRTVGVVFDEALKRYYERKAAKDAERKV